MLSSLHCPICKALQLIAYVHLSVYDYVYVYAYVSVPCSPPGGATKMQGGELVDGDGKSELHIGKPLIFEIRRASTLGSVSISGPPGGTVPSRVIWDLPNCQTLQNAMVSAQVAHTIGPHEQPEVTHTSVSTLDIQHVAIDALPHHGRHHLDAHT